MKSVRCEEVIVQVVIRSYDDAGRPVKELTTQPIKVFRNAETRDFWAQVDKFVTTVEQQAAQAPAPPIAPAPVKPGKSTRKR